MTLLQFLQASKILLLLWVDRLLPPTIKHLHDKLMLIMIHSDILRHQNTNITHCSRTSGHWQLSQTDNKNRSLTCFQCVAKSVRGTWKNTDPAANDFQLMLSSVSPRLQALRRKATVVMQHSHPIHLARILAKVCFPLPCEKVLPLKVQPDNDQISENKLKSIIWQRTLKWNQ